MKKFTLLLTIATASTCAFAAKAPKSAAQYYSDAAFQYIENRLPTAEITCKEGLSYYPDDAKLQMLQDRIEEAKDEQQKQNQQNNPNNENQNQNQDQNQEQNQDPQNQNSNQNEQNSQSSSSENQDSKDSQSEQNENQDQQNQNANGSSSSESESSNGSSDSKDQEPKAPQNESPSDAPAQMSPQEASQLLKDFDEEHGERKPWKPVRGQARPEKDW